MKYVINSIVKTKAKYLIILDISLMIIYIIINAKILVWISSAIHLLSIKYVNLVLVACLVQIVISTIRGFTGFYRHISFTYLNEIFVDKILDSDIALFNKFSPGAVQNAEGKAWHLSTVVSLVINISSNILSVIVNIIAIWLIQPKVIIPIIIIFAVCVVLIVIMNNKWNDIDKESEQLKEKRNEEMDEIINGFTEVRSFSGTIEFHRNNIKTLNKAIKNYTLARQKINGGMDFVISLVDTLAMMFVLTYIVTMSLAGNINMPSATSVTLLMYIWRIIDPLLGVVFTFSEVSEYKASIPKFSQIMEYQNEIIDGSIELESFNSGIEINNVSFSYDGSDNVLNNVSIDIPKGSKIGICGVSGGGKSTLLRLLTRFYDVDTGSIKIDGIDIRNLKYASLRKYIGIVHQNTYIFDGTIRDNIAYALAPNVPSDEVIIEACKKASIEGFVVSLPEGLNTKVGPRGLKLSGGQKQRIGLARIFLMNPEIVVLDEATSALDNETESLVQDALCGLKDKTIITIAHRLSTIRDSDCIYVIDNHTVAEHGNHQQLIEANGIYANMQK